MINSAVRGLWLAIVILAAALVGAVGGLLAWSGGLNVPMATLTGAAAFSSAVLLFLAMFRFVTDGGA